jgi:sialate O-acetylesterase
MATRRPWVLSVFTLVMLAGLNVVRADVHLDAAFGSNMVLQRDMRAKLVGWADVGEEVIVKLGDKTVGKAAGEGKGKHWTIPLPVLKAGPIPDITIAGKNTIILTNLLAGDVWVCSGQSNMGMTLQKGPWCGYGGALNAEQEVAAADHPTIRLMTSPGGDWKICLPDSARAFSAAGYFFGRELQKRLNIPIGLIQAAVGGTDAALWTPRSMREGTPEFTAALTEAKRIQEGLKPIEDADRLAQAQWRKEADAARRDGGKEPVQPVRKCSWNDQDRLRMANSIMDTGRLYDSMISPLTVLTIKGAIWYQGESNARQASEYTKLISLLIGGWRKGWNEGDFPFLIMQLVNFDFRDEPWYGKATFALLRDAQQMIANTVPNTGIAVGIDIGEAQNIHPGNKQEVGRRLALVALKQVYKQDVVASGPKLTDARFESDKVTLMFDPGGKGQKLVYKNSANNGFELAGADGKFVPATAGLHGCTITLTAQTVIEPRSVRYAWSDNPTATLFNTDGLPAAPFRKTAL